jgi:uncharacterized protein YidB (DUF937 family)
MDRWKRWHSRGKANRAVPRRAGVKALALLILTGALASLLAVWSDQAWPPVLVSVIGTLPGLYLAWLAVPGATWPPESHAVTKPIFGRLATQWNPVDLGVHRVIGGRLMPSYVRRPHDELLGAVLDPAESKSRMVVVRGASSAGKTRAAYEAVLDWLPDWQLDYPLDVGALAERLNAGIPARTVLWLGELRQYAEVDGGPSALGRLADLLDGDDRVVITTIWPEHWNTYTSAMHTRSGTNDRLGGIGRLLDRLPKLSGRDLATIDPARGGVIDVPDRFSTVDLQAAAAADDPLLTEAAAAAARAGQDGELTQYLAGVPDLLRRYDGPGGDPYGQAVIRAAMEAARLGHDSPLPAALLQEAAVGYLTGPQRTEDIATWRDAALAWASTELNGAVRALQPVPPRNGTGIVGYRVADYLDQYGRRTGEDGLGPASLWDALIAHTVHASDMNRLGYAARARGLYRRAAAFGTMATALGNGDAAGQLVSLLSQVGPEDALRAAEWAVSRVGLYDPASVAFLLEGLRQAGAHHAAGYVASRAASQVNIDDLDALFFLVLMLREAGASDAISDLASRAGNEIGIHDIQAVGWLLEDLRRAEAWGAALAFASQAASRMSLDEPQAVVELLAELRQSGADDAVRTVLARDPAAHVKLEDPQAVAGLLDELREVGAHDAVRTLLARDPAAHVKLEDPQAVAGLLRTMRQAGATDAARSLATRAATDASLGNLVSVARLLGALREVGDSKPVASLASRAARQISLEGSLSAALLLEELREARADEAIRTLLARCTDAQVSLDDLRFVAELLGVLRRTGGRNAVYAMVETVRLRIQMREMIRGAGARGHVGRQGIRRARYAGLDDPSAVAELLRARYAGLDDPSAVAELLRALRDAGAGEAVTALAARAAARISLDNPSAVAQLLRALRDAAAVDAVTALASRAAANTGFDYPVTGPAVASLLDELREMRASEAVTTLASGAINGGMFELFVKANPDETTLYHFGRELDGSPSEPWKWQEPGSPTVAQHAGTESAQVEARRPTMNC